MVYFDQDERAQTPTRQLAFYEVQISLHRALIPLLLIILFAALPASSQTTASRAISDLGDRITLQSGARSLGDMGIDFATRLPADYRISLGDKIVVTVRGRVGLNYSSVPQTETSSESGDFVAYEVMPDGTIHLPLIGALPAEGRTAEELRALIVERLAVYYKNFSVDLSVAKPGFIRVWVSGQVENPGAIVLPSAATVVEAIVKAGLLPNGSSRRLALTRDGATRYLDAYAAVAFGNPSDDLLVRPGDAIHVPAVVDTVTVSGEVCRPGTYELASLEKSGSDGFNCSDLIRLCLGTLPTALPARATIERTDAVGNVIAVHVDLTSSDDFALQPGDRLVVPRAEDYQPTIRLVGEFEGQGVFPRSGSTLQAKSGVYRLAMGETLGDVILKTGGLTARADLKRAKIERMKDGFLQVLDVDLDRLLIGQDKSADISLVKGDTVVIPGLADKVFVLGEVAKPGALAYEPGRRMLDYVGIAGGPGSRAKSSAAMVVRGDSDKPEIIRVDIGRSIVNQEGNNPVIMPGDVIFLPEKTVANWRDVAQIISTIRLLTVF